MKTAREKAEEWFNDYAPCAIKSESNISSLSDFITGIRKEQDKITRHACAGNCDPIRFFNCSDASVAHEIIMNTKAV